MTASLALGVPAGTGASDPSEPEPAGEAPLGLGRAPALEEERNALLAELLRSHYGLVWRTLRQLGVDPSRVDDAAQEVFIVASRKLEQIEPGRERKYLLSSALRIASNYRRAGRARREVSGEELCEQQHDPTPPADQLLQRKRLRGVLDALLNSWPVEVRTVFVLFELEGLSVPEIAELTEAKAGTVASRLRRARELFQMAVKRLRAQGGVG